MCMKTHRPHSETRQSLADTNALGHTRCVCEWNQFNVSVCVSVSPCRQSVSPSRDKRWRDGGGERPVRSWQSGGGGLNRGGVPPPASIHPSSSSPSSLPLSSAQRSNNPSRPPPPRSRPSHQNQMHLPPQSQYRNNESNAPQMHPRERQGPKAQPEPSDRDRAVVSRGGRGGGGRGGPSVVVEDTPVSQGGVGEQDLSVGTTAAPSQPGGYKSASPRRQQEHRGSGDRSASGLTASSSTSDPSLQSSAAATNREASPPTERPVERKSYSLARRTRSRPADLGSKQPSVEESAVGGNASSPSSVGGKSWTGAADGPSQAAGGGGGALTELDQDVARLSLAGQSWSQSPTSYIRSEMRGESQSPDLAADTESD